MLLLFLIWGVAELAAMVLVAEWIGVFWMLILLCAGCLAGTRILRWQMRAARRRLTTSTTTGSTPTLDVIEGALGILAGGLFLVPGFLSDIVGAVLLIGPVRRPIGKLVSRSKRLQWVHRSANWVGTAGSGFGRRGQRYDAESTAYDINDQQLDPHQDSEEA